MYIRGGVEDTRFKAKNAKKNPRPSQGQPFRGQTLSRPSTGMLEVKAKNQGHRRKCSPKKGLQNFFSGVLQKKVFKQFFQAISKKKIFKNFFQVIYKILTIQKYYCPRAEDKVIFEDLRLREQSQGLDLRGRGHGLQNVSSRPRTSSRTPPLVYIHIFFFFDET